MGRDSATEVTSGGSPRCGCTCGPCLAPLLAPALLPLRAAQACRVGKLFAKHFKVEEQAEVLRSQVNSWREFAGRWAPLAAAWQAEAHGGAAGAWELVTGWQPPLATPGIVTP